MRGKTFETHVENGCHLHDNCFTCPVPDCEIPTAKAPMAMRSRARAIELKQTGIPIEEIAKMLGQPLRVVARWV